MGENSIQVGSMSLEGIGMTEICGQDWERSKECFPDVALGCEIHSFPRVASTQLPAKEAARQGAPHGAVYVTDFQSDGRGRRDRGWHSLPGRDLTFSIVVRPDVGLEHASLLNFSAAVAVACTVADLGEAFAARTGIKWPNDVLIGERKICGVICESVGRVGDPGRLSYAVLGIGVNANRTEDELPAADSPDRPGATSLRIESGRTFDLPELLGRLLVHLDRMTGLVATPDGRARLIGEYKARCFTMGRPVRIVTDEGDFHGTAVDISGDGALIVENETQRRSFHVGDVVHARLK